MVNYQRVEVVAGSAVIGKVKLTDGTDDALVTAAGLLQVDASGTTVPVSVSSLPLPSGAATETTLSALNTKVTACNTGAVVVSSALPAGSNNIGDVDLASSIPAGSAIIGKVGIDQTTPGTTNGVQINAALPAGSNNIGDVDVLSIAAGDNNIGNVDVVTLPALITGSATIGRVIIRNPSDTLNLGDSTNPVRVDTTGSTTQPVSIASLPSLAAGSNNIGDVDVLSTVGVTNRSTFITGQKNVTTPGTAVQLDAQAIPSGFALVVQAKPGNTGNVWIGNSAANAQDHAVGYLLAPGDGIRMFLSNANLLYLDAAVASEGVQYVTET